MVGIFSGLCLYPPRLIIKKCPSYDPAIAYYQFKDYDALHIPCAAIASYNCTC
ncbi:MAG: hypothetical protein AB4426_32385 [Xenococcaceae cyanobacterium]